MACLRLVALSVFTAMLCSATPSRADSASPFPLVAAVWGELRVEREGEWDIARPGTVLMAGERLRTGSADRAKLVLANDGILDLAPGTAIALARLTDPGAGAGGTGRIEVLYGKVRARWVRGDSAAAPYHVETPTAAIVRGNDYIVAYDDEAAQTEVVGLRDGTEVLGRIAIAGGSVTLASRESSIIRRGQFPVTPERIDDNHYQQALHGFTIIGTGGSDGLAAGHPATTGRLLSPRDLPEAVPAEAESGRGVVVEAPRSFLADEMSPDFAVHDQPLNEYLRLRSGGIDVDF